MLSYKILIERQNVLKTLSSEINSYYAVGIVGNVYGISRRFKLNIVRKNQDSGKQKLLV